MDGANKLLIGTTEGNQAISINAFYWALLDATLTGSERRNYFRGKNLGSGFTDEQLQSVWNGTFKGLFTGDYWEAASGRVWRIADFDYWWNVGDTDPVKTHHVVIFPDRPIGYSVWSTHLNDGFASSELRTNGAKIVSEALYNDFGPRTADTYSLLSRRERLSTAMLNGETTGISWYAVDAIPPSCEMIYGYQVPTQTHVGGQTSCFRLALLSLRPEYIILDRDDDQYWMFEIATSTAVYLVHPFRTLYVAQANASKGIRYPVGICGRNTKNNS